MSSAFRGKLIENIVVQQLDTPLSRTASATLYNGVAATTTSAIDGMGFDEVVIVLTKGTATSTASVTPTIVQSDATDPSAATAVTGGTFTTFTTANAGAVQVISLQSKDLKRYLWLKTERTNVNADQATWGAIAIKKSKETSSTAATNVVADLPA